MIFKIGQLVAEKLHIVCWFFLILSHPVELLLDSELAEI